MVGHRLDDGGTVGLPPHDCNMDCGDDRSEGQRRIMGLDLGGRGSGGERYLADEGVRADTAYNNFGLCCREADV